MKKQWPTECLGSLGEIVSGSTPKTKIEEYWGGDLLWVTPAELGKGYNGRIFDTARKLTGSGFESASLRMLPPDTVLLTSRAPIGKVALSGADMCTNQGFKNIVCDRDKLEPEFLYHFLVPRYEQLNALGRGATFKEISKKIVSAIEIPLPPLEEQRRIVEILDAAQALIDQRKEQLGLMDQLVQSLFYEMFGDPVTNLKRWKFSPLSEVLTEIVGGKSVGGEDRQIEGGEDAVLKISAVTSGTFLADEYKVVPKSLVPEKPVRPAQGDLLFSRANTRELVGATCIVDKNYDHLFLPDKLWKLELNNDRAVELYLKNLLSHSGFRARFVRVASGTSGSMLNISKAKLRSLEIPLPPIELQTQFAERVEAIEVQKAAMAASLVELETTFQALMQRAFKGELTG